MEPRTFAVTCLFAKSAGTQPVCANRFVVHHADVGATIGVHVRHCIGGKSNDQSKHMEYGILESQQCVFFFFAPPFVNRFENISLFFLSLSRTVLLGAKVAEIVQERGDHHRATEAVLLSEQRRLQMTTTWLARVAY